MSDDFLEWLTSNASAFYPFKEETRLWDDTDQIELPKNLFLDLVAVGAPVGQRYFIGKLLSIASLPLRELTFEIIDQTNAVIATITRFQDPADVRKVDSVIGQDQGRDVFFKWVWGEGFLKWFPAGLYWFTLNQAEFESCNLQPIPNGVLSVSVLDPNETLPIDPFATPLG